MSTHAVVGIKTATGFRGRYVHFDGYPDAMVPALVSILRRDGFNLAVKTITEIHTEWTTLVGTTGLVSEPYSGDVVVPGYGNADSSAPDTRWYTEASLGPAHWGYVLTVFAVEVWQYLDDQRRWVRRPDLDTRWDVTV